MQRDNEWFDSRLGRFTGSEIHKLMGKKGIGQTGNTYAFEKACEIVFGRSEEKITSFDMQRGIELEPVAFALFKEKMEYEFVKVEECGFFPYKEYGGASPDGLVGDYAVLEIKCPRRNKFFNLMLNGLEAIDEEYLWQMHMEMLCTNSQVAYFFNYLVENGKQYHLEIEVKRDEGMIMLMQERMLEALEIRNQYVEKLKSKIN
jgi:putative phage-type endonuclease